VEDGIAAGAIIAGAAELRRDDVAKATTSRWWRTADAPHVSAILPDPSRDVTGIRFTRKGVTVGEPA